MNWICPKCQYTEYFTGVQMSKDNQTYIVWTFCKGAICQHKEILFITKDGNRAKYALDRNDGVYVGHYRPTITKSQSLTLIEPDKNQIIEID